MGKFEQIVSKILQIPVTEVKDSLTSSDIPGWDSMNYLLLIAELEKQFKYSFTMDEVMDAKNLGDLRVIIEKKGH